jgi:hypothetical protein
VLKQTTKAALCFIRTCRKLEGFWYQKQFFGLFSHPVHCCVGFFGVNSKLSKKTLLATSVVVLVLKEPRKTVITTCNKLEGFWYQNSALYFFSHPVH